MCHTVASLVRQQLLATVQGSAEAVRDSVMGLADGEVGVKVVSEGVGPVTTTDIDTARATGASILAFNVKYANAAVEGVAKVQAVKVVEHKIIYRMLEEVCTLSGPVLSCLPMYSLALALLSCRGLLKASLQKPFCSALPDQL